jgi:hypothetical protein
MSHEALGKLLTLIPADQPEALASIGRVKHDFSFMAPELENKRWHKLWTFLVEEVIPHNNEAWTTPIKTYWAEVVPGGSSHQ